METGLNNTLFAAIPYKIKSNTCVMKLEKSYRNPFVLNAC